MQGKYQEGERDVRKEIENKKRESRERKKREREREQKDILKENKIPS